MQRDKGAECSGQVGCKCNTGDIHSEDDDEEEIQTDIQNAGEYEGSHGTPAVSPRSFNRCCEIVQQKKRQACGIQAQVENGLPKCLFWCPDQTQHRF